MDHYPEEQCREGIGSYYFMGLKRVICQSALFTFLTLLDSNCSKLELWWAVAYLECGRVSYGISGRSLNLSGGVMKIGQRLDVIPWIILFSIWFANYADRLGMQLCTFSSLHTISTPWWLLVSDNGLRMELKILWVICTKSNSWSSAGYVGIFSRHFEGIGRRATGIQAFVVGLLRTVDFIFPMLM